MRFLLSAVLLVLGAAAAPAQYAIDVASPTAKGAYTVGDSIPAYGQFAEVPDGVYTMILRVYRFDKDEGEDKTLVGYYMPSFDMGLGDWGMTFTVADEGDYFLSVMLYNEYDPDPVAQSGALFSVQKKKAVQPKEGPVGVPD